ncbi:MAG TPA: hypothetical protein VI589_07315, partial [Vicinamibacteria bacterium]
MCEPARWIEPPADAVFGGAPADDRLPEQEERHQQQAPLADVADLQLRATGDGAQGGRSVAADVAGRL